MNLTERWVTPRSRVDSIEEKISRGEEIPEEDLKWMAGYIKTLMTLVDERDREIERRREKSDLLREAFREIQRELL